MIECVWGEGERGRGGDRMCMEGGGGVIECDMYFCDICDM